MSAIDLKKRLLDLNESDAKKAQEVAERLITARSVVHKAFGEQKSTDAMLVSAVFHALTSSES